MGSPSKTGHSTSSSGPTWSAGMFLANAPPALVGTVGAMAFASGGYFADAASAGAAVALSTAAFALYAGCVVLIVHKPVEKWNALATFCAFQLNARWGLAPRARSMSRPGAAGAVPLFTSTICLTFLR